MRLVQNPSMTQAKIPSWRAGLAMRSRVVVVLCSLGMTLPWMSRALAGREDRLGWVVDLAAHWQWPYLAGFLAGTLVASLSQKRWLFALLLTPLPWWTASPRLPADEGNRAGFVVASANVHLETLLPTALTAWLATANADVAVLVEVSPSYAEALSTLPGYQYQHLAASNDPFGMAVISRHPMQATTFRDADGIARIEAGIDFGDGCVELIAVHPMPPLTPHFHAARDELILGLAQRPSKGGLPTLVVGDLNATPWSSAFAGLADRGLQRASGLRPTWPSVGGGWIGIPIDHVLASSHWRVSGSELGPDLGSDHRPLLTRLVPIDVKGGDCKS